ncbi:trypsin-like [Pectinophora gossypiella]|uniref:trypsin-like n=1 Tax=Pectinophora gossypiella TaxID=13191 RepID=UPI00214E325C|nr:trypsin-like [Pectinophora gossypiella]
MDKKAMNQGTRRLFGGTKAQLKDFPPACLLTDRSLTARCSGAVVAPHWVLTAAHCISPSLAYVKYNTRTPSKGPADQATIVALYQHPKYEVVQEDEGRGLDVTQLHNDIGLAETKQAIELDFPLKDEPIHAMRSIEPKKLQKVMVQVMGFGRTETAEATLGEELFAVTLRLQNCERSSWFHCMCGLASPGERARGVCSGDSGGPVVYSGVQVGVTSMGPLECVTMADPTPGSTSVFTSLYQYADILNDTINNVPGVIKMSSVALDGASTPSPVAAVVLALFVAVVSNTVSLAMP